MEKLIFMIGAAAVAVGVHADTINIDGVTWMYSVDDAENKTITLGGGTGETTAMPTDTSLDAADIPWTMVIGGDTYTVTRIADYAFQNCTGLSGTLTIPEAVTFLGRQAIYNTTVTRIESLGGVVQIGPFNFQTDNLTHAFPDLSRVVTFGTGSFFGSYFSGVVKLGKVATALGYRAFSRCPNLTGVYIPGPDTVASGRQSYTTIDVRQMAQYSSNVKIIFVGVNTKGSNLSSGNVLDGVTGCKMFVPANGFWDGLDTGGTSNEVIYYGASTNLNLIVDEDVGEITATPADEGALVKVLEAAPTFKNVFGRNIKVNVTNVLEATSGAITAEMLSEVEINTLMLTFKVNTQAQLDSVLAAIPASSHTILAIDASDSRAELTVPQGREVYVRLSGEGRNGKYTPKINGTLISFR